MSSIMRKMTPANIKSTKNVLFIGVCVKVFLCPPSVFSLFKAKFRALIGSPAQTFAVKVCRDLAVSLAVR